jgi:hypothetical protein
MQRTPPRAAGTPSTGSFHGFVADARDRPKRPPIKASPAAFDIARYRAANQTVNLKSTALAPRGAGIDGSCSPPLHDLAREIDEASLAVGASYHRSRFPNDFSLGGDRAPFPQTAGVGATPASAAGYFREDDDLVGVLSVVGQSPRPARHPRGRRQSLLATQTQLAVPLIDAAPDFGTDTVLAELDDLLRGV